jgi:hypothetical protein
VVRDAPRLAAAQVEQVQEGVALDAVATASATSTGVSQPSPTSSVPSSLLIRCEHGGMRISRWSCSVTGSRRQIQRSRSPCV